MGRKQSKRQTVREKVMVRKKVRAARRRLGPHGTSSAAVTPAPPCQIRDHERKLRKEARRNPSKRSQVKKSLDVPNTWPFKEQLINQVRAATLVFFGRLRSRAALVTAPAARIRGSGAG